MLLTRPALCLLASILISACTKDEESAPSAGSFDASVITDFQAKRDSASLIEANDFQQQLTGTFADNFFSPYFEDSGTGNAGTDEGEVIETCLDKENSAAIKVQTKGKNLTLSATFANSDACIEEMKTAARAEAQESLYGLFIADKASSVQTHITCSDDVSAFNDADPARLDELFAACGTAEAESYRSVASAILFVASLENGQVNEEQSELEWENLKMDPQGSGCSESWEGNKVKAGECVIGSFSKASDRPSVNYLYAKSANLQATRGSFDWYDSGSWTASVNNWDGTVSYNGGNKVPSYTFSNGTTEQSGLMDIFASLTAKPLDRLVKHTSKRQALHLHMGGMRSNFGRAGSK